MTQTYAARVAPRNTRTKFVARLLVVITGQSLTRAMDGLVIEQACGLLSRCHPADAGTG